VKTNVVEPEVSSLCLDHAPLPMATVEGERHIVQYVNPAFCRMLDQPADQLVGKPFCEILPEKDDCVAMLDRVYRTGRPEHHTEQHATTPDPVFGSYTMWPVVADERPAGVMIQVTETAQFHDETLAMNEALLLGSVHQHELTAAADSSNALLHVEITERKRSEEQLKASVKEVGGLNTEIQEFYHTLSHELKTPLTSAREFVSIVMDGLAGPLNKTQLEYLGMAKESCDQLRRYINDLLDVTRLETGKMSIEFQALPLAALVERVVEMLAPAAAGKGVSLSCDCQPDLPAVPIDKQRILQVLINLTTNAIKFTPSGGQIRLSLSEAPADPECLQVDVRDTGRGIPKDQLDVIFNRRYQANHNAQSANSQDGLGLGLYICQELVDLHGGRIWAESEVGKGSTFSFVVPKLKMTKGGHVLIVDDDYGMRESLRLILEDQHFEVTTAEGGSEALLLMGQKTPDVVVLDLMMAGLDGPGTLKEIRKNWGLIPVIVYTGYPDGDLMRQAMEFSPFTLLTKPCPLKQFVETVRRMCHPNQTRFLKKNAKASQAPVAQST
jgi:signal transduction histidine kinase/CheY-like chemotaxis protein